MAAKDLLMVACVLIFVSYCVLGFPNSGVSECSITSKNTSCNVTHAMFREGLVFLEITLRQEVKATMRYTVLKHCSSEGTCSKDFSLSEKNGTVISIMEPLESCILAKKTKSEAQNGVSDGTQDQTEGDSKDDSKQTQQDGKNDSKQTQQDGKNDSKQADRDGNDSNQVEGNSKDDSKQTEGSSKDDSKQTEGDGKNDSKQTEGNSEDDSKQTEEDDGSDSSSQAIIQFAEDGIYMVKIDMFNLVITPEQEKRNEDKNATNTLLEVHVIMKNPLGFLDAADYPYLVFYSLMFVGYFFLGIIWSICMCCSCMCCFCKDLIRLQLFIGVAILLGFAESMFFVSEYGYVNNTGSRYTDSIIPLLIIAEGISAGKKTFARVLLIIISSGFGTIISHLGSLLWKVLVFGGIFFAVTLADGFVRAYYYSPLEGFNNTNVIPGIILLILDIICLFWIVSSLIRTRRTLKENNDHWLNTYNYFCCTLVVISVGVLAFLMWIFITTLMGICTQDWRGFWLKECFWPLLFTILLVVIMILWRPSSKPYTGKVVYTAVPQGETKEMAVKDNFETMRMRHGSKSEGLPLNSDSEEDVIFFQ